MVKTSKVLNPMEYFTSSKLYGVKFKYLEATINEVLKADPEAKDSLLGLISSSYSMLCPSREKVDVSLFLQSIKDIKVNEFYLAFTTYIKTSQQPPRPSDIRTLVEYGKELQKNRHEITESLIKINEEKQKTEQS